MMESNIGGEEINELNDKQNIQIRNLCDHGCVLLSHQYTFDGEIARVNISQFIEMKSVNKVQRSI